MNASPLMTRTVPLPPVDRREVLRYAGSLSQNTDPGTAALLEVCLREGASAYEGRVCWRELPARVTEEKVLLGDTEADSGALARTLRGCDRVIVFLATVGVGADRLIARASVTSPAKALLYQALGTERVEALCDAFCDAIRKEAADAGKRLTARFSPGYGDLPLTFQKTVFSLLEGGKTVGVSLTDRALMIPGKSVTALMGLY